jgi:hypothetical protein
VERGRASLSTESHTTVTTCNWNAENGYSGGAQGQCVSSSRLVKHGLDDADLGRHLGAADDGCKRPLGLGDGALSHSYSGYRKQLQRLQMSEAWHAHQAYARIEPARKGYCLFFGTNAKSKLGVRQHAATPSGRCTQARRRQPRSALPGNCPVARERRQIV